MKALRHFGPGSSLPAWMEELDRGCFGQAWGPLAGHEEAWGLEPEAFAIWSLNAAAEEAELLRVAVAPAVRQRGLGRRVMEACEVELARAGIRSLLLEVRVSNAAARKLYQSGGWVQDGLRRAYYRDGEDAALYRKDLGRKP